MRVDSRHAPRLASEQGLIGTVGVELRRLFRPPYAEVLTVGLNVLMVSFGWFLLPLSWRSWLFDNLHGALAFAIVMETWMLSDVTSTNLFGHDEQGALAALERPGGVKRFMVVKIIALSLLIGIPCAILALVLGLHTRNPTVTYYLLPMFLALPMGLISVTSWLGIVFPYRLHSLKWRWERRRDWKMLLRWTLLVLVPYVGLSPSVTALLVPGKIVGHLGQGQHHGGPPPPSGAGWMALVVVAECALLFSIGPAVAQRLANRRRQRLLDYFHNPDAG